jgi:hypothetical protein
MVNFTITNPSSGHFSANINSKGVQKVNTIEKSVKSTGGNFSTIQSAINHFKNIFILDGNCIIKCDKGVYVETINSSNLRGTLEIIGDLRAIVDLPFVHGKKLSNHENEGAGLCSIRNEGSNIIVNGSIVNPNFGLSGVTKGDNLLVSDNRRIESIVAIEEVSENKIKLTSQAPNLGEDGSSVTVMSNRILNIIGSNPIENIVFVGFRISNPIKNAVIIDSRELENQPNPENKIYTFIKKFIDKHITKGKKMNQQINISTTEKATEQEEQKVEISTKEKKSKVACMTLDVLFEDFEAELELKNSKRFVIMEDYGKKCEESKKREDEKEKRIKELEAKLKCLEDKFSTLKIIFDDSKC